MTARDEIARVIAKAEESTRTGSKPQRHRIVADAVIAWLADHERKVAERAWDAAVRSMRYEDGTPVEIVAMTNPYRADAIESEEA